MPDDAETSFAARAAREIDDLHRLLEAWFNAAGGDDPAPVLAHFDEGFAMITPGGKLLTFAEFRAAFPGMRGTRAGLLMEIGDVVVRQADAGFALVTYRERQTQGDKATERLSTALLLDRPDRATPVWRHLHETWIG